MDHLPDELCTHIFQYLALSDLGRVAVVCKRFSVLCRSEYLWAKKLELHLSDARSYTRHPHEEQRVLHEAMQLGHQLTFMRYFHYLRKSTFVVTKPKSIFEDVFLFRVAERVPAPWLCGCGSLHSADSLRCARCLHQVEPYQPGYDVACMLYTPLRALRVLDLESSQQMQSFQLPAGEDANRLSCCYPLMAVGMESGAIAIFDMRSGVMVKKVSKGFDKVWMVLWSRDGRRLLTLHGNTTVAVWRVADHGRVVEQEAFLDLLPPSSEVYFMSLDGHKLWLSCSDGSVAVVDIAQQKLVDHVYVHQEEASRIEAVQDSFVCGSFDRSMSMGRLEQGRIVLDVMRDFGCKCNGLSRWLNLSAVMGREQDGRIAAEIWDMRRQSLAVRCIFPTITERETTNSSLWYNGRYLLFCASLEGSQGVSLLLCDLSEA